MAAFNWIDAEVTCPKCGATRTARIQTHVASGFDGDDSGRFCMRTYRLGQRMAWWPGRADWRETHPCLRPGPASDECEEACLADCGECREELCVVIRFKDATPIAVLHVAAEREWPEGYRR